MSSNIRAIVASTLLTALAVVAVPSAASAIIVPPPNNCGGDVSNYSGSKYLGSLSKEGTVLEFQVAFAVGGLRVTSNINGPTQRSQSQSPATVRNDAGRASVVWNTLNGIAVGKNVSCLPGSANVVSISGKVWIGDNGYDFLLDKTLL